MLLKSSHILSTTVLQLLLISGKPYILGGCRYLPDISLILKFNYSLLKYFTNEKDFNNTRTCSPVLQCLTAGFKKQRSQRKSGSVYSSSDEWNGLSRII